jgi:hypothetical protein
MRIPVALVAALSALVLASAAGGVPGKKGLPPKGHSDKGVCEGTVTGPVAGDLVVPEGATCDASGAVVRRRVRVGRNATLTAGGSFSAARGVDVGPGATLRLVGTHISIGGVQAHGAKKVALIKEPLAGSSAVVGGSVLLFETADVSVVSLIVGGQVLMSGGGADGVEVGANRILRSLDVTGARVLRGAARRIFSIRSNVVGRDARISANNARGANSLFIGGNRILRGNLTCRGNVPAPVNIRLGRAERNSVPHGAKRGQCARL